MELSSFFNTIFFSFVFSIVAILFAQWIWGFFTGPRIVISMKGMGEPNSVNGVRYLKMAVTNTGATAARSALIRVKANEAGKNDNEVEVVPKWDATPEASLSGYAYLYDSMQRINLPPGGTHEELCPIMILPTKPLNSYIPFHLYLFSNWRHYSAMPVDDIELTKSIITGKISVDAENCYVNYDFTARITKKSLGKGQVDYKIKFTSIEPSKVKWWLFSKGKIERDTQRLDYY